MNASMVHWSSHMQAMVSSYSQLSWVWCWILPLVMCESSETTSRIAIAYFFSKLDLFLNYTCRWQNMRILFIVFQRSWTFKCICRLFWSISCWRYFLNAQVTLFSIKKFCNCYKGFLGVVNSDIRTTVIYKAVEAIADLTFSKTFVFLYGSYSSAR